MTKGECEKIMQGWTKEEARFKLNFLEVKVEQLDHKINRKADEVVSFQVLQHRSELEAIYETLNKLNIEIKRIDAALSEIIGTSQTLSMKKRLDTLPTTREVLPSL